MISYFFTDQSGLSLRFQVAGYLLFVAGEVASSHDDHVFIKEKYNILRHQNNKFLLYVKARWRVFLVTAKWEYTCKHRV